VQSNTDRAAQSPKVTAGCASATILNTGKGDAYRYYSCSKSMKQGKIACAGRRIRMDLLDGMVP